MKKNSVIVLITHGSRLPDANLEVLQVAEKLQGELDRKVVPCFLEITEPSISKGIDLALQQSPEEILVLPYFLTQGRHVQEDIPKILAEKARAYPETPIRLLDYLGKQTGMVDLLKKTIQEEKF